MNKKYLVISERIKSEIGEIEETVKRILKAWELSKGEDPFYLDSVALNLHNFYSGLERIFNIIAKEIDEVKIDSPYWHQELLKQMSLEIQNIRPSVISNELREKLEEYKSFRHVVRNIYAYKLKPEKIKELVEKLPEVWEETKKTLLEFSDFLESI